MSSDEYERFEITDHDLDTEFNPNRNRRRPTKNQNIYGIWADDGDSDDGGGQASFSGRRRGGRATGAVSKDYSAPVSFVAGGVQQAGKEKENSDGKGKNKDDDDEEMDDDDANDRPAFGAAGTSSESDGEAIRPSMGFRKKDAGGAGQKQYPGNIAHWEKHTTGIGSKLLLKMGYEPGRGLGKNLQGISTPIEAHVRKGRGAIGAYGSETGLTLADQKAPKKVDEDVQVAKEFKEKLQQWKKSGEKGKKFRYFYKAPEDLIGPSAPPTERGKSDAKFLGGSSKLSQVTVIDMTGPEKRVLSGYHALGQSKASTEEVLYDSKQQQSRAAPTHFNLPELMYNLNLIVNLCEQEIIAGDKQRRQFEDQEESLTRDKKNLERVIDLETDHIQQLEDAARLVEQLVRPRDDEDVNPLTLEQAERIFLVLQTDFESEYDEFQLDVLAPGVVAPLIQAKLRDWRPLQEPTRHLDILRRWKELLRVKDLEAATLFEPYSALVWAGVVPSIRHAATVSWNPKEFHQMVALLDAWAPLLPTRIFDNILEQIVLSQVTLAVEQWDPLTDHVPIHQWILPWTGLLGDKLQERVYPTIREKLGSALTAWVPQDRSALAMLRPWRAAFREADLKAFLQLHVVPKLQAVLAEVVVNPLQQDLEYWQQFWEWHELLPAQMTAQLLDKFFFPRWMQTLVIWLNQSPNLDQVARWYSGWKALMADEEVQREVVVREHLRRALEVMHRATGSVMPVDMQPVVVNVPPTVEAVVTAAPPVPVIEFKELLSQKCADRGIIFAPTPGRRENGKQVYRIGKMFCVIDRSVIMITDGTFQHWAPVSLAVALERALSG